jgi:hypothetical protein
MPFTPTPRSLRDEAAFDLLDMHQQFQAIATEMAHVNRRLAKASVLHRQAIKKLREAQAIEDAPALNREVVAA